MKLEINAKLKFCKHQLDALGPSRASRDQQFKFLLELATKYQTITSLALKAHYGGDELFDSTPTLRLATAIVGRNATFSDDVWQRGHMRAFQKEDDAKETNPSPSPASFGSSSLFPGQSATLSNINPKNSKAIAKAATNTPHGFGLDFKSVRYEKDHAELEELTQDDSQIPLPNVLGIKQWLEDVYKDSRGFELGTFDASLLPIIWKKQTANWEPLALGYVKDIVSMVHSFTVDLLAKICKDPRARQGLHAVLLDQLTERYKKSIDHTKFVLAVERFGTPLTTNHYFADNLEKRYVTRSPVSFTSPEIDPLSCLILLLQHH